MGAAIGLRGDLYEGLDLGGLSGGRGIVLACCDL